MLRSNSIREVGSWLLVRANRWLFTGIVLVVAFFALVAVGQLRPEPVGRIVESHGGVAFLFTAFVGAIVTGTSIVVTVAQLVLSQELGAVGDQRERMSGAVEFRRDVEALLEDEVAPAEPAAVLAALVGAVETRAGRLSEAAPVDDAASRAIGAYADAVTDDARTTASELEGAEFGTYEVIRHALGFDYSRRIVDARWLRADHGDALSPDAETAIEELIEALTLYGPAREHFKTLYFQWALIDLSRAILFVSVPALLVVGTLATTVDAAALPGSTLGVDDLVWVISAGFAVGLAPFVVFFAYVLRITTVAKRTLSMGPFVLHDRERG